jgi:hypothetical protein
MDFHNIIFMICVIDVLKNSRLNAHWSPIIRIVLIWRKWTSWTRTLINWSNSLSLVVSRIILQAQFSLLVEPSFEMDVDLGRNIDRVLPLLVVKITLLYFFDGLVRVHDHSDMTLFVHQ